MQKPEFSDSKPALWRLTRTWGSVGAAIGLAALALLATGCPEPGDLEDFNNPTKFPAPAVVAPPGGSCETACITKLFQQDATCKICHSGTVQLGKLDLASAGVIERLKDKPAAHDAVDPAAVCPTGDLLISTATPAESWLLKKVTMQHGTCGTAMPPTAVLSEAEVTCVRDFVNCVAGSN